jgi:hypothetical protein
MAKNRFKINLIYSNDVDPQDVNRVYEFLKKIKGPFEFIKTSKPISLGKKTKDSKPSYKIGFELSNKFRSIYKCDNEFIVLLASSNNDIYTISGYLGMSTLIDMDNWKDLLGDKFYLPIAYLIVQNISACYMVKDKYSLEEPYVHFDSIGCINDTCFSKKEVLPKLKSGDICEICLKRLKEILLEESIQQWFNILKEIKKEIVVLTALKPNSKLVKLFLNSEGNIAIPELHNKEIDFTQLEKTLYILYLRHPSGIKFTDLANPNFRKELISIYRKFINKEDDKFSHIIDKLIDLKSNSFSERKSKLNSKIRSALGDNIFQNYIIDGNPGSAFIIKLPSELIDESLRS